MQPWDTHEPVGDWIPLASAPALDYLGGYQIGYRLQASGEPNELQRVALTVAGVPDGQPSQPYNAPPYCVTRAGAVGSIVAAGAGAAVRGRPGPTRSRCRSGRARAARTAAGRARRAPGRSRPARRVAPVLSGSPLSFRATPPLEQRVQRRARGRPARRAGRHPLRARRARAGRRLRDRRRRRARRRGHPRDGARERVPAAGRVDVRRPRHRRRRGRGLLADGLRRDAGPRR